MNRGDNSDPKLNTEENGFSIEDEKQSEAGVLSARGEGESGTGEKTSEQAPAASEEREKKLREILGEKECEELLTAKDKLQVQEKILEEKDKLLQEYEDLLKRKQAEFENYRKRVQRELEEFRKYATSELILDILNIIDDFERAIESAKSSRDFDLLLEGIMLVEKQFRSTLEKKHGVEKIETVGREFDPTVHDAIMMEESGDYAEDTVVEAFQNGYKMYERVLRPAKVKVAKAVSPEDEVNEMSESSGKGE